MKLEYLKYFQTVANSSSITEAAKELELSQSALSRIINKMEEELGYPLFVKQSGAISLTPYGEKVLDHSCNILNELEDIQQGFRERRGEKIERKLRLGIADSNYYSEWLLPLLREYPDLQFNVLQMSQEEIQKKLLMGELDFGISYAKDYHSELDNQLLFNQPYQLLVLKDHPLAQRGYVTIEQLVQEPLLSLSAIHKNRLVDNLSAEIKYPLNIVFEGSEDVMRRMFHAGMGSILTCVHNCRHWMQEPYANYELLDIPGSSIQYKMYLVWPKKRYYSEIHRFFKSYVFDYYHIFNR